MASFIIPTLSARCSSDLRPAVCPDPNLSDLCMRSNANNWKRIYKHPMFSKLALPTRYWNLTQPPFDTMPPDAIRLNYIGNAVTTSLTANVPNIVMQYPVPFGFEGIVNEHVNLFQPQTGPGYQDGSGDLIWRIEVNQYLLTYYTNVNTSMGSLAQSGGVRNGGGFRIKSNQTITYSVIPTVAALGTLDPVGQVICGIRGWIYPIH